jgi:hypothetical protein
MLQLLLLLGLLQLVHELGRQAAVVRDTKVLQQRQLLQEPLVKTAIQLAVQPALMNVACPQGMQKVADSCQDVLLHTQAPLLYTQLLHPLLEKLNCPLQASDVL